MLKKLLKYDILSMFPYYLMCAAICVGLSVVTRLSYLLESDRTHGLETVVTVLSMAGSTVLLAVVCGGALVVATVLPAVRFYRNLLRDEGYLMFTLPATPTELYFSKLLCALFGILFMGLTVFVCFCITFLTQPEIANEIWEVFGELLKEIAQPFYDGNVRYIVESILVVLFGLPVLLLGSVSTVFASLCLGQLSNKNKLLLSFAAFAGIGIVQSTVSGLVSTSAFVFNNALIAAADTMILVRIILSFLLMCACNWVSLWILNKKLNLE